MRRLPRDQRALQEGLLALNPRRRLFVQRWIELFDRDAIYGVRPRSLSSEQIGAELRGHHQADFHVPIMREELASTVAPTTPLDDLSGDDIDRDPIAAAETLAARLTSLGFHPSFLYQAFKLFLSPPSEPFDGRLARVLRYWSQNGLRREITVVFRPTGAGARPSPNDTRWSLLRWSDLPRALRDSVRTQSQWWVHNGEYASSGKSFLAFASTALDVDHAAAIGFEAYASYRTLCVASGRRPIPIDKTWVLAHDGGESPSPSTHAFKYDAYRFRVPALDSASDAELIEMESKDDTLRRFRLAFAKAAEDVRQGEPQDALADLAQGLDLSLEGYVPSSTKEQQWGAPRLFVEKAAIILALDSPCWHFRYFLEYVLSPSYAVTDQLLFGKERRPEVILRRILDDASWKRTLARAPWDELLKWRRDLIREVCRDGSGHLRRELQVARWDLARAVRARNAMFHRGQPARDAYLIAVLLRAFEGLMRVRMLAYRSRSTFAEIMRSAEEELAVLQKGGTLQADFVSFGWRRMRSVRVGGSSEAV